MPNSLSSSSSPSSSSLHKQKKRKWSREQLLKSLEILGTLSAPLPPDLPPSPPASRATSPVPSSKRKYDSSSDAEHSKRPRMSSASIYHSTPHPPLPHLLRPPNATVGFNPRSEPAEDGEVREETARVPVAPARVPAPPTVTSHVPVRRPRRGKPSNRFFDEIHDKYHQWGRMLKYSGDARFWSTYPSTHKEYRPLANPPLLNSPYHKFAGLISRLELMDALVCFTYSIWSKDYSRKSCLKTWATIEAFLSWCKHKWSSDDTVGDREKAFIGLIWMIEAFIHGRKFSYAVKKHLDVEMNKLLEHCTNLVSAAVAAAEENSSAGSSGLVTSGSNSTPAMLPSPASIAPTKSANSTPTNRADGTPNNTTIAPPTATLLQPPPSLPASMLPSGTPSPAAMAAAASVTVSIGPSLVQELRDQSGGIAAASWCMDHSQKTLSLPLMARHFPTTFARMIHSSLLATEEHEPDIEDEEGELLWPGQLVTGEGLGWVCLMGKAMIKELGKEIGYEGLDGVVPKPKLDEQGDGSGEGPAPTQVPGPPPSLGVQR